MDGTEEPTLASGASVDELVPGSVEQILGLADALSGLGDGLLDAANALSRIEVTGWYGAASDVAHGRLGQEPSRWSGASGAFTTAGSALRRYAAALAPAREKATQAVEAYRRYLDLVQVLEVATAGAVPSTGGTTAVPGSGQLTTSGPDRAELGRRAAVLVAADQGRTDPSAVAVLGPLGTDLSGLAHSADALRRQAVALLAEAREQVAGAGDVAADAVQAAMIDAPDSRTFWQGTIRKPGAEDAAHSTLDVAGFIPGWVGIGATLVNVGWYALEDDSENAAYSAMGLAAGPFSRVAKGLAEDSRAAKPASELADSFRTAGWLRAPNELPLFAGRMLVDKPAIIGRGANDLDGMARDFGLEKVGAETFRSPGGLTYGPMAPGIDGETNRLTHTLLHGVPDPDEEVHSVFSCGTNGVTALVDRAWSMPKYHDRPNDPARWLVDFGDTIIGTGGQTKMVLVVKPMPDGSLRVITAYPL